MTERQGSAWTRASTPTSITLYAVEPVGSDVIAVGSGGIVLERRSDGWVEVDADGPAGAGNDLYAASTTADGKRVWFGGASGALGYYDRTADEVVDRSAPEGITGTWNGIAVTGTAGTETIRLVNGSGEVLHGTVTGEKATSDETVDWTQSAHSPDGDGLGSGASVHAIEATADDVYASNDSGRVFAVRDGSWTEAGIGAADSTLYDVAVAGSGVFAVSENGTLYRHDGSWNAVDVADGPLYGVAVRGNRLVVVGASGRLFEGEKTGTPTAVDLPVDKPLRDVGIGKERAVAVGGSGVILEHPVGEQNEEQQNADQQKQHQKQRQKQSQQQKTEQPSESPEQPAEGSNPKEEADEPTRRADREAQEKAQSQDGTAKTPKRPSDENPSEDGTTSGNGKHPATKNPSQSGRKQQEQSRSQAGKGGQSTQNPEGATGKEEANPQSGQKTSDQRPGQARDPTQDTADEKRTTDTGEGAASEESAEERPAPDEPTDDQPAPDGPANDQPISDGPANEQPTSDKPANDQPTSDEPTGDRTDHDRSGDDRDSSEHDSSEHDSSERNSSERDAERYERELSDGDRVELPDGVDVPRQITAPADLVAVLGELIGDVGHDEATIMEYVLDDDATFTEARFVRDRIDDVGALDEADVIAELVAVADIDVDLDGHVADLIDDEVELYETALLHDMLDVPLAVAVVLQAHLDDDDVGLYRLAVLHEVFVHEDVFGDVDIVVDLVEGDADFDNVDLVAVVGESEIGVESVDAVLKEAL